MNIVIVGTGYVGLVTGVGFAEQGHTVSFIDLDSSKINKLNNKQLPFFEPDLDNYFSKNLVKIYTTMFLWFTSASS